MTEKTAPISYTCAFPECGAEGWYGFREPGVENLAQRNPAAVEIWCCAAHREAGPAMLQARLEARVLDINAAARRDRAAEISAKARREEGLLF